MHRRRRRERAGGRVVELGRREVRAGVAPAGDEHFAGAEHGRGVRLAGHAHRARRRPGRIPRGAGRGASPRRPTIRAECRCSTPAPSPAAPTARADCGRTRSRPPRGAPGAAGARRRRRTAGRRAGAACPWRRGARTCPPPAGAPPRATRRPRASDSLAGRASKGTKSSAPSTVTTRTSGAPETAPAYAARPRPTAIRAGAAPTIRKRTPSSERASITLTNPAAPAGRLTRASAGRCASPSPAPSLLNAARTTPPATLSNAAGARAKRDDARARRLARVTPGTGARGRRASAARTGHLRRRRRRHPLDPLGQRSDRRVLGQPAGVAWIVHGGSRARRVGAPGSAAVARACRRVIARPRRARSAARAPATAGARGHAVEAHRHAVARAGHDVARLGRPLAAAADGRVRPGRSARHRRGVDRAAAVRADCDDERPHAGEREHATHATHDGRSDERPAQGVHARG